MICPRCHGEKHTDDDFHVEEFPVGEHDDGQIEYETTINASQCYLCEGSGKCSEKNGLAFALEYGVALELPF